MQRPKVLRPQESYTFSRYFELAFDIEDILGDLGCSFRRSRFDLPQQAADPQRLALLAEQINDGIRFVSSSSEQAKREFLIAPFIREVCRAAQQEVRVEYPVAVSAWLKGTFDYYFGAGEMLVIEAKRDNLDNGMTQLAAELVALDQWSDRTQEEAPVLYGAVTTGLDWRFAMFNRQQRSLTSDLKLYRVPEELQTLFQILLGLVQPSPGK